MIFGNDLQIEECLQVRIGAMLCQTKEFMIIYHNGCKGFLKLHFYILIFLAIFSDFPFYVRMKKKMMLLYKDFGPTVYLFLMNGKIDEYLINIARLSLWHIGEIKNALPLTCVVENGYRYVTVFVPYL